MQADDPSGPATSPAAPCCRAARDRRAARSELGLAELASAELAAVAAFATLGVVAVPAALGGDDRARPLVDLGERAGHALGAAEAIAVDDGVLQELDVAAVAAAEVVALGPGGCGACEHRAQAADHARALARVDALLPPARGAVDVGVAEHARDADVPGHDVGEQVPVPAHLVSGRDLAREEHHAHRVRGADALDVGEEPAAARRTVDRVFHMLEAAGGVHAEDDLGERGADRGAEHLVDRSPDHLPRWPGEEGRIDRPCIDALGLAVELEDDLAPALHTLLASADSRAA